jgi:hypothetical protein
MTKFKVGDRVRALNTSECGAYTKGNLYVVKALGGSLKTEIDDLGSTSNGWGYQNFELIQEDSLESLIKRANEGYEAEHQLRLKYNDKVEWNNGVPLMGGRCLSRLQIKKPKFEPFTTSNGWKVIEKGSGLYVGCRRFDPAPLKSLLIDFIDRDAHSCGLDDYRYEATRKGIYDGSNLLLWPDAERIYEQLKKVV